MIGLRDCPMSLRKAFCAYATIHLGMMATIDFSRASEVADRSKTPSNP